MLYEEFKNNFKYPCSNEIYDLANWIYMEQYNSHVSFTDALNKLIDAVNKESQVNLMLSLEKVMFHLFDMGWLSAISADLAKLLGTQTYLYLKARNNFPFTDEENEYIAKELRKEIALNDERI